MIKSQVTRGWVLLMLISSLGALLGQGCTPMTMAVTPEVEVEPIPLAINPNVAILKPGGQVVISVVSRKWETAELEWEVFSKSLKPPGELSTSEGPIVVYQAPPEGSGEVTISVRGRTEEAIGTAVVSFRVQLVTAIVEEEVTVAPEKAELVEVTMWTSVSERAEDVLRAQLEQFREENPHITVLYENLPYDAFLQKYEAAAAGGVLPDVVGLGSYTIQRLSGLLMSLDEFMAAEAVDGDDFVRAGLNSSSLDGQVCGLPWFRAQPCSPFYYSLGLSRDGAHHAEAFSLISFLTRSDVQVDRYHMSEQSMLPTRFSAYEQLGFECPPSGQVAVLPPREYERAVTIAEERAPRLQEILDRNSEELAELGIIEDPQTFGTRRSTAAITYGDQREPLEYDPDEPPEATMLAVATPVDISFTREAFDEALSGPGVIVGALFGVDEPLLLRLAGGDEFAIEPDANFAVRWQGTGGQEVEWWLVDENGNEHLTGLGELEDLMVDLDAKREEAPDGRPYVTIELGTCYIFYHIDWYKVHAYIANESLNWYVDLIHRWGGTVYWWACW